MEENLRTTSIDALSGRTTYNDGEIAIVDTSEHIDEKGNARFKLDMTLLYICLEGEVEGVINNKPVSIKKNDMVICAPNFIIENMSNNDKVKGMALCLSPSLMLRVKALTSNSWDFLQYIKHNPIIPLTDEQVGIFLQYYEMMCSSLNRCTGNQHKEIVYSLLTAFFYELFTAVELLSPHIGRNITSADLIFQKYIDLLSSMYPRNRTVAYYADRLNVTPKYLSVVCKQIGGKTALHYINAYVNEDIRQQLTKTNKSIKEICTDLEFANLSFFGKYVRRQFGMGPTEYRKRYKV